MLCGHHTARPAPRLRRLALVGLLCLATAVPPASAQLPALGEPGDLSVSAERQLGERIARELYRDPDYIDDPVLVEYVQAIWQPLLAAARARGELTSELDERFAWQVLLGKDRTINAFALPGGWLGLHLGLVAATTNRHELASVLAHELSHVTQRHISRMVSEEGRQAPWVLAALILGALAASRNAEAGRAVMTGSQALAAQQQLNFSREMEREADRIGLGILQQAGFDPMGAVTIFEKLLQAGRLNDSGALPYLRTHPLSTERAADMQARQPLGQRPPPRATLEHALIAARARVLSSPGVDALRAPLVEADSGTLATEPQVRQAGVFYAAALAAHRLREPARTQHQLQRLQAAVAGDPAGERQARLLAAEIALAAGDLQPSLRLADTATAGHRPELLLSAQAQVRSGRAGEAAARLQTWVSGQPRDAAAWQLLAAAHAAKGQPLRAVRAEGEARAAQLDYPAALDRFRAAQELARRGAGDHIEASIVDTRARELESLAREQALER